MKRLIYLDHAATTPLSPAVLDAMLPYLTEQYGNPASLHKAGLYAKRAVDRARAQLAAALHCEPEEIFFTASGSEANYFAAYGSARALRQKNSRPLSLFTTPVEHSSMLDPLRALQAEGNALAFGCVNGAGKLLTVPDKACDLAFVQLANNETGIVQPIPEIAKKCLENGTFLHVDAVQGFGQLPLNLKTLPVSTLSLSAHKFHGPKGAGALFIRAKTPMSLSLPKSKRLAAGTENVAAIVGMGAAAELAVKRLSESAAKKERLRLLLRGLIQESIPDAVFVGERDFTLDDLLLPGILSVSIPECESEGLLTLLDLKGICASAGAACHAGEKTASHVLTAIGLPDRLLRSVIRFSIGEENTEEEIRFAAQQLFTISSSLRALR